MDEGTLAVLDPAAGITLSATRAGRLMLLGAERFPTPRFIEWYFIASSRERIERTKAR